MFFATKPATAVTLKSLCMMATLASIADRTNASDLPTVNLGLTSFVDGALPAGPGLYYQNYLEYYDADRIADNHGRRVALPDEDINVWAETSQFTYYFKDTIGPGRLALDVVIPAVINASTNDGVGGAALSAQNGLGDILFGPIYQFDPTSLQNGWVVLQDVEMDVLAPTGEYDRHRAINPGSNAWALDPFYAVTLAPTSSLSFSGRLHYLYNFKNSQPDLDLGPYARTLQAGQAFHLNLAIAYALSSRVSLGLNSYYLKQFTDSKVNDVSSGTRSERVLGVGPGAFITATKDTFVFVNLYGETLARNRPEGNRCVVRVVHHF